VVLTHVRAVADAGRFAGDGLVHAYLWFHASPPTVIAHCGALADADKPLATSEPITCPRCAQLLDSATVDGKNDLNKGAPL
jgi:hypothetical protein